MADLRLVIKRDEYSESPIDSDDLVGMVLFHNRYLLENTLGLNADDYLGWDDLADKLVKEYGAAEIVPVYMMDHGGLALSDTPFSCPWDSGQVGLAFVTRDKAREHMGWTIITKGRRAALMKYILGAIKVYGHFLAGDCHGYTLTDGDGGEIDSGCGFYGMDSVVEAAADSLKYYGERL